VRSTFVIDWQLVSGLGQLAVGVVLAVITGIYVKLTHRMMKASLVQANVAETLAKLTLDAHRDDRRRNAEKILSTFSLIDLQIAWLMMEIETKESMPLRFAARHAERMEEPLKMSRRTLCELDDLPMQAEVRSHLRDTNGALMMLIDAIPLPLTPGYEMPDWEARIALDRMNKLGPEIRENARVAMNLLNAELRSLAAATVTRPPDLESGSAAASLSAPEGSGTPKR
jgi:c-di-GMP-related signal transduction protein